MNKTALLAALFLPFVLSASLAGGPCFSTPLSGDQATAAPTRPEARDFLDFDSGMESLSRLYRITLIAEDRPLKYRLNAGEAKALAGVLAGAFSKEARLEAFARQFDYEVTAHKEGCYLLRKRFTSNEDFPHVSLAEWKAALSDVGGLLKPLSPGLGELLFRDPTVKSLIASFTPEQIAAMKTAGGVPVTSLGAAQKDAVRVLCLYSYVQEPMAGLEGWKEQTDLASRRETRIGWFAGSGGTTAERLFGFADPAAFAANKSNSFLPLNDDNVGWNSHFFASTVVRVAGVKKDETAPAPLKSRLPADNAANLSRTLAEVCESLTLSDRDKTAGGKGQRFTVVPMLASKPVTITGARYMPRPSLFRAIGALYGLRTRYVPKDQTYYLERERVAPVADAIGLRDAVRIALPASYLRCIETVSRKDDFPRPAGDSPVASKPGRSPRQWRIKAVRRLRELTEPRLIASKSDTAPVSDLNRAEYLLTNVLMADAAITMKSLAIDPTPAYLTDFNSIVLTGGPNRQEDRDWFDIGVYRPRAGMMLEPFFGVNVLAQEPVIAK